MLILGVDPGVKGGWAMVRTKQHREGQPRLEEAGPLPVAAGGKAVDVVALAELWRGKVWLWPEVTVVIEGVGARPGQGAASTWSFARAVGAVEGVVAGLGAVRYHRPSAGAWKASYGLTGGKAGKGQSIALAERLMGQRMVDHEAEAALLAWWAAKKETG